MTVSATTTTLADLEADLLLIPFTADAVEARAEQLARSLGPALERAAVDFAAEAGEVRVVYPEEIGRAHV